MTSLMSENCHPSQEVWASFGTSAQHNSGFTVINPVFTVTVAMELLLILYHFIVSSFKV